MDGEKERVLIRNEAKANRFTELVDWTKKFSQDLANNCFGKIDLDWEDVDRDDSFHKIVHITASFCLDFATSNPNLKKILELADRVFIVDIPDDGGIRMTFVVNDVYEVPKDFDVLTK